MGKNRKTILITGGVGFIGSHISRMLLDTGYQVTVLDNLSSGAKENVAHGAKLIVGDIRDSKKTKEALEDIDTVIHLAGLISVSKSVSDPISYCNNNVLGTVNLLNSMKEMGVTKIIFSSSSTVYGEPQKLPLEENMTLKPSNPYGATKASIESFLQSYNAVFVFDVVILRYFNPYGPGELHDPETHAIPNFIKATLAKNPIPLYWQGEQIRDYIYITDLVSAHLSVLHLNGFNVFNVGSGTAIKTKDLVNQIFKIIGSRVPIANLGQRPGDVTRNYASIKKLHKTTGWRPTVNLEKGLKKTIEWLAQSFKKR